MLTILIPEPTRTTERLSQFFNLVSVWIDAYFSGRNHGFNINHFHDKVNRKRLYPPPEGRGFTLFSNTTVS